MKAGKMMFLSNGWFSSSNVYTVIFSVNHWFTRAFVCRKIPQLNPLLFGDFIGAWGVARLPTLNSWLVSLEDLARRVQTPEMKEHPGVMVNSRNVRSSHPFAQNWTWSCWVYTHPYIVVFILTSLLKLQTWNWWIMAHMSRLQNPLFSSYSAWWHRNVSDGPWPNGAAARATAMAIHLLSEKGLHLRHLRDGPWDKK